MQVKGYYINEIKLINFVERFYNENCLAEIFRVGLAHLALMGEPPLPSTTVQTYLQLSIISSL